MEHESDDDTKVISFIERKKSEGIINQKKYHDHPDFCIVKIN